MIANITAKIISKLIKIKNKKNLVGICFLMFSMLLKTLKFFDLNLSADECFENTSIFFVSTLFDVKIPPLSESISLSSLSYYKKNIQILYIVYLLFC